MARSPARRAASPPDAGSDVTARDGRKAETRQRILDAARELVLAEGVDGFSMRKLAARIGYTATAIYFHFPDKDALLVELVDSQFQSLRRAFDRFQDEQNPRERLRRMGRAYLEFALRHPDHYRFMFLNPALKQLPIGQSFDRTDPAQDGYALLRHTLAEALDAGRLRPEFRDAEQAAQIIWASLHGLVALHLVKGEDPRIAWRPARPTGELLVDAVLRGIFLADDSLARDASEKSRAAKRVAGGKRIPRARRGAKS